MDEIPTTDHDGNARSRDITSFVYYDIEKESPSLLLGKGEGTIKNFLKPEYPEKTHHYNFDNQLICT